VVEGYDEIRQEPLSKTEAEVFRDNQASFRLQLSVNAYQNGLNANRAGHFNEAVDAFQEAIRVGDEAAHVPAVKLELARTLLRVQRAAEAALLAQELIDQNVDKELQDDGAWLLSQAADQLGNAENARNALRLLLHKWPRSSLLPEARKRLAELTR
jgi:hypothetical protein